MMGRYIFGGVALIAAIAIVAYSATTLFAAAFYASADPWQQWLNGTGAAALVIWEASALLLIGGCWYRGYKPVAFIASVALVAAMVASLSWEARSVIGGQADKFASRDTDMRRLKGIDDDLAWARDRRAQLSKAPSSEQGRRDMNWITNRIAELEKDRMGAHAVREVMPQAAWAARLTGWSEQRWQDIFTAAPLFFWLLARIVAIPLAVAGMTGARKPEYQPNERAREAMADYHAAIKTRQDAKARQEAKEAQEAQETERFIKGISLAATPASPLLSHPEAFSVPAQPLPLALQEVNEGKTVTEDGAEASLMPLRFRSTPGGDNAIPGPGPVPFEERPEADGIDPVFDYSTRLRLTPKEIRRLAREQNLKKNDPVETSEIGNVEVWASLLLRPGKPNQSVTSGECRDNFREYCEMHGLQMVESKKLLSRQIGVIIDRMTEGDGTKGKRRSRNAAGAVFHNVTLLEPSVLLKLSPEKVRA